MIQDAALEVVVLRVTDVDRALRFYRDVVGFHLDVDYSPSPSFRVVQLTPNGSHASIQFGVGLSDVPLNSVAGLYLMVDDVEACREGLIASGVAVTDVHHKDTTAGSWAGTFRSGVDPEHADYASFAKFCDPDGNRWVLQERGHDRDVT